MDKLGNFFIKPTSEKVKVRCPRSFEHLKAEGEWKPRNSYWLRRVRDQDVVEAEPPKTPTAPPPKS